jgi:hypothetical protein
LLRRINVRHLFGEAYLSPEGEAEAVSSDGLITTISLAGIINIINLEMLSQDEVNIVRARQDRYSIHVYQKRLEHDKEFCTVDLFRIIFLSQGSASKTARDNYDTSIMKKYDNSENNYNG